MPFPRRDRPEPDKQPTQEDPVLDVGRNPYDDLFHHRAALYLAMGFSEASAQALAGAKDGLFPLHPGKVQKSIKGGATPEQALAIFV